MATDQRPDSGARWDQLSPEDAGSIVAARRDAREAEAAKRTRRRHHAKWIAINLALIAFTGWLYAAFLIPRFIVGDTAATRVGPDTWIADRPSQSPAEDTQERSTEGRSIPARAAVHNAASLDRPTVNLSQERRRLRREQQREPRPAYANSATVADMGGRCIGGRVFRSTVTNGVTVITKIEGATCTPEY